MILPTTNLTSAVKQQVHTTSHDWYTSNCMALGAHTEPPVQTAAIIHILGCVDHR